MKRCIIALLVLMSSCAGRQEYSSCVTPCGIRLVRENFAVSCSSLQAAEPVILEAFDGIKGNDERFARDTACKSLSGLKLYGRKEFVWAVETGVLVLGVTYCEEMRQEVGESPEGIYHTSLAHEMAHVVQHCDTRMSAGPGDYDDSHGGWTAIGLNKLLNDLESRN